MAVPGDLAKPRFGLSEDAFTHLAESVDAIYHNGAVVNFVFPYHLLRDTNGAARKKCCAWRAAAQPNRST